MDFNSWIAGFVDGEGSFYITKPPHLVCGLTVQVRADDEEVLHRIQGAVGAGRIKTAWPPAHRSKGGQPSAFWLVTRKQDALTLVEFFDKFPLQAKKRRDYAIWRKAVLLHQQMRSGQDNTKLRAQIQLLKQQMEEGRKYS